MLKTPFNHILAAIRLYKAASMTVAAIVTLALTPFSSYAQLPEPIENALQAANISPDNISIVIAPVTNQAHDQARNQSENQSSESNQTQLEAGNSSRLSALTNDEQDQQDQQDQQAQPNKTKSQSQASKGADGVNITSNSSIPGLPTQQFNAPQLQHAVRHLANVPRTPASTLKLVPTFIALDLLGPDFTWFTKVYHTGYVHANTLYGDLIIEGGADPKLTHEHLGRLLQLVKDHGIRHIKGNIIVDSAIFQDVAKDPAAFDNDPLRPYNASPDGLLINFNSIQVNAYPIQHLQQANKAKLSYKPKLADYHLPNTLPMSASAECRTTLSALAPSWQADELVFNHPLPTSCDAFEFYIAYPNTKDFAKRAIKHKWLNLGNSLSGNIKFLGLGNTLAGSVINTEAPQKTRFGSYLSTPLEAARYQSKQQDTKNKNTNKKQSQKESQKLVPMRSSIIPSPPLPFASYPSAPLSQQIHDINHYSNNVMTEQLTLTLPLFVDNKTLTSSSYIDSPFIKTKHDSHATYPKALAVINQWWQQKLQTPAPVMSNGSGLCQDCTATSDNLAELLTFAYSHPDFDTFANSLRSKPLTGLANIISANSVSNNEASDSSTNTQNIGRAWYKTGTLSTVSSVAGYVQSQSGQDYVVVGIINSDNDQPLNTYNARAVLDTVLNWTAQQ
ncbi:D-alanyl-D-alanine carboxypeptidase/D-alanyl-D-alanine-endopeptidase [Psychrobacter sp. FDAARGOS_221]|uniref:D-alanyl-D-alanine carboxypeptidase/D-alanyl-D-alanine-endopeptidase n=1 Tax=Psychrobacter sp. FDAARGOS_221 TaxID=1975705 RepID=UPI00187D3407|nr:D-alanyl-D-alanine carboxypeptidase [Psychrobacter sp. FDAARGOS_221]